MPKTDAIVKPGVSKVDIRLDPVQTIIHSMVLMARSEELSGLNPWIYETVSSLTPEQKATHYLVLIGVHYAVLPTRVWKDFPTYLAHLENSDPLTLRDKVLDFYLCCDPHDKESQSVEATKESLMEEFDFFLEYLQSKFKAEYVIPEIEEPAYQLLKDPVKMQQVIVSHLRFLWQ